MSWTFRLMAMSLVGCLLYVSLASVTEYAAGLAIVRIDRADAGPGEENTPGHVVALLPARYLPMLRSGLPLSIELNGFPNAAQPFVVESVSDDLVSREDAHRYLGS